MSTRTAPRWAPGQKSSATPLQATLSRLAVGLKAPLVRLNRRLAGLTTHRVSVAGHDLHYLDGGRGEPVLLLHGIFAEKDHWVDLARRLRKRHRLVVPDLPGFGESSRHDQQRYGYAEQVERLITFMDAVGLARVHVAGNSMGGTLGALLALMHPARVASLAFIGAPHGLKSPVPSETDRLIEAGQTPLMARNPQEFDTLLKRLFVKQPWLPWPVRRAAQDEAIRLAPSNLRIWQEHLADRYLLDTCIARVAAPLLVLWGRQDRVFHVSGVRRLRWKTPGADIQVLDQIGHLPMMEDPDGVAARLAAHLERHRQTTH